MAQRKSSRTSSTRQHKTLETSSSRTANTLPRLTVNAKRNRKDGACPSPLLHYEFFKVVAMSCQFDAENRAPSTARGWQSRETRATASYTRSRLSCINRDMADNTTLIGALLALLAVVISVIVLKPSELACRECSYKTKLLHPETKRAPVLDPAVWQEFPLVEKTQISPNTAR
jgi:hypothetical protein